MGGLLLLLAFMAIFYVMILLPQRRQMRTRQAMISALAVGDEVVTTSGIYGTVSELRDDDTMRLAVAPGLELTMVRGAVGRVVPGAAATPAPTQAEVDTDADADGV